jgi:hypothetical protein
MIEMTKPSAKWLTIEADQLLELQRLAFEAGANWRINSGILAAPKEAAQRYVERVWQKAAKPKFGEQQHV